MAGTGMDYDKVSLAQRQDAVDDRLLNPHKETWSERQARQARELAARTKAELEADRNREELEKERQASIEKDKEIAALKAMLEARDAQPAPSLDDAHTAVPQVAEHGVADSPDNSGAVDASDSGAEGGGQEGVDVLDFGEDNNPSEPVRAVAEPAQQDRQDAGPVELLQPVSPRPVEQPSGRPSQGSIAAVDDDFLARREAARAAALQSQNLVPAGTGRSAGPAGRGAPPAMRKEPGADRQAVRSGKEPVVDWDDSSNYVQIRNFPKTLMNYIRSELPEAASNVEALAAWVYLKSNQEMQVPDRIREVAGTYRGDWEQQYLRNIDKRTEHLSYQVLNLIKQLFKANMGLEWLIMERMGEVDNPTFDKFDLLDLKFEAFTKIFSSQAGQAYARAENSKGREGKV